MQANDRDVQLTVEAFIQRVKELQQSIVTLLAKLDQNEKLEWPAMLENFAVLSSQFTSLMQILQSGRTPNLKNVVLLPVKLSLDLDPNLQRLTENRVPVWSHAVVPDYLRTKVNDRIFEQSRPLVTQQGNRNFFNPDNLQKMVNQMNKACSNAFDLLTTASKDEIDVEGSKLHETCNQKDTEQLVLAVSTGLGLKPNLMQNSQQPQGGGKYASSVKASMKNSAVAAGQPYGSR